MKGFDFESEGLSEKLSLVKKKAGSLSLLRLLVFFVLVAFLVLSLADAAYWFLPFGLAVSGFIELIRRYNYQKDQEAIYLALQKLQQRTEKRKARNLPGLDTGAEFMDKFHPFSNDLDLFGDHSLFQLLNHTISPNAKKALASKMKSSFHFEESEAKRLAAQELSKKPKFLQAMESIGRAFYVEEKSAEGWIYWLKEPQIIKSWISVFAFIGPIGGIILSAFVYFAMLPPAILGIWILSGMIFLSAVFKPLKLAAELIPSRNQLKIYRYWIAELERENFNSDILKNAQSYFLSEDGKASELLNQLDRLGLWIQNRSNFVYLPINLLFWTDLFLFMRLSSWKRNHGETISEFPEQLENWEVLISLGSFEAEVGVKGKVVQLAKSGLVVKGITHPLLHPEKAVANDFVLDENQRIILLTGSNMSGKTTFMRTLGINCVLMNLGLNPFAQEFGLGPMQLFTSMRNSDNLGESVSSFYAELSRIHTLIERLEAGEEILFFLDEILKGTNTEDRIAGSEALIRQVRKTNAIGIISTHDIELAELEKKIESLENFSFHSEIHDQRIDFDYKIKSGACPSFNAHKLMELMGIRFQDEV